MLGARMAALIIDGLVLVIPLLGADWVLSLVFPHHGFFISKTGAVVADTGRISPSYTLGVAGLLVTLALSLVYFFLFETLSGQTVGKRAMGLSVRSAKGGRAGVHAVAIRTLLRILDALPVLYLIGLLSALLSGSRRRRLGDLLAGTVVTQDEGPLDSPPRLGLGLTLYPLGALAAVFTLIAVAGVGATLNQREQALALVRSYVKARERGNATLACSMLTVEQQRELVAIQGGSYQSARAARCPAFILRTEPQSHLLNPMLPQLLAAPLTGQVTPVGAVVVHSLDPPLELVAVPEDGHLKLDVRGLERLGYVHGCTLTGRLSSSQCLCIWGMLRDQGMIPEGQLTPAITNAMADDDRHCVGGAAPVRA